MARCYFFIKLAWSYLVFCLVIYPFEGTLPEHLSPDPQNTVARLSHPTGTVTYLPPLQSSVLETVWKDWHTWLLLVAVSTNCKNCTIWAFTKGELLRTVPLDCLCLAFHLMMRAEGLILYCLISGRNNQNKICNSRTFCWQLGICLLPLLYS